MTKVSKIATSIYDLVEVAKKESDMEGRGKYGLDSKSSRDIQAWVSTYLLSSLRDETLDEDEGKGVG
jgi:hypothetical protein